MGNRIAFMALLVAACGGGHGSGDDVGDDAGDDAGIDAGVDGAVGCTAAICSADTCGTPTDACGDSVQCPRCRFDADVVSQTGTGPVMAVGDDVQIAIGAEILTRDTGWSADTVTGGAGIVDFALAPDGTRWVAMNGSTPSVAFETGTTWTVEGLGTWFLRGDPAIAVGADGTAFVAFGGETGAMRGLIVGERDAGVWSFAVAYPTDYPEPKYVDIQILGGEPYVAFADDVDGTLKLASRNGTAWTTENVDANTPAGVDHHLALAFDDQSRPHIAYRQDWPFQREIDHAFRDGTTWQHGILYTMRHGAQGAVRLVTGPGGNLAAAWVDTDGLSLATYDGTRWFRQPVSADEEGSIDLGYDAAGTLYVAVSGWDTGVRLFTRDGSYPADYDATCASAAASLCPLACACDATGGSCCWETPGGTDECADPENFCEYIMQWRVCGDASQDPGPVTVCDTDAPAGVCNTSTSHLVIPDSCPGFL
jgi:hypothetical protein